MWKGKRILVGITGGIAAYKTPLLVRELIKLGAEVKCIMTPASFGFVTPLTLATLSKNEVHSELYNAKSGVWTNHVDLALWADLFIIAPLTAASLAKMAIGHSDNLLLTTYLSSKCPVYVAPAMDLDMHAHPTTKANFLQLEKNGVIIIPSQSGELASGLVGEGRMEEPIEIIRFIESYSPEKENFFLDKKVLITAGPTYEAIDPVRFIGNHSSGKMGVELAYAFAQKGAKVHLILGPSVLSVKHKNIEVSSVESANEMLSAVQNYWKQCNIGVFAAAVADYRPKDVAKAKIKKLDQEMTLVLEKNPDILSWAGENKTKQQC
ncbi:MAG: bifunctional phosphopantothenoylcysteine decarboxylase/phosphopantothenate--cysteine ligase CoaBC, partial [Crocinitomicaceae bacterium]